MHTMLWNISSGAGVLNLRASLNTAEQNSSLDSCSLVDTMPSLLITKQKKHPRRPLAKKGKRLGAYIRPTHKNTMRQIRGTTGRSPSSTVGAQCNEKSNFNVEEQSRRRHKHSGWSLAGSTQAEHLPLWCAQEHLLSASATPIRQQELADGESTTKQEKEPAHEIISRVSLGRYIQATENQSF